MDDEVTSCMIELLHFLNGDIFQGTETAAGPYFSKKYSKSVIDKAAVNLIDNGYTLGDKSSTNGVADYFAQTITSKGIEFLKNND